MNFFYWDASALAKRYTIEIGTPLVNHLFANAARNRMLCLTLATSECISIFVRRKNAGLITNQLFFYAMTELRAEVVNEVDFILLPAEDTLVFTSHQFIEKYSLNATDALVLCSALNTARAVRDAGDGLVLIAADLRLLRAAQAEGLLTFNPEIDLQGQLDALIR